MNRPFAVGMMAALALSGCQRHAPPSRPTAAAHFVVGPSWQGATGAWFYPRQQDSFTATGLAVIDRHPAGEIAADGEPFDPGAAQASVQTLQLPCVVSVQDLETGRSMLVRAVGRGPDDPGRLIALSPVAARLLGMVDGQPAQVRVVLQSGPGDVGTPKLAIAAAPVGAVSEEALGPPGTAPGPSSDSDAAVSSDRQPVSDAAPAVLPLVASQGAVQPGSLWVDGGRFAGAAAARSVAARLGTEAHPDGSGREAGWRVESGPYRTVAEADAALDRARRGGVTGARIVVE